MRDFNRRDDMRIGDEVFLGAILAFPIAKWIMDKITGKKQKEEKALRYQSMSADEQREMDLIDTEKGLRLAKLMLVMAGALGVILILLAAIAGYIFAGIYEATFIGILACIHYRQKQSKYKKIREK